MKKILSLLVLLVALSTAALAGVGNPYPNPTSECNGLCNGMLPIAKWEVSDVGSFAEADDSPYMGGFSTYVSGNDHYASWTSSPAAGCIIVKYGNDFATDANGGLSGAFNLTNVQNGISHITFCGNENNVPEFGFIAGTLAIAGAGAGYLFLRRKN